MVSGNLCKYECRSTEESTCGSKKSCFLVFTDVGDDEDGSAVAIVTPAQGDVRRVKYSAEMAEIGFPAQSRD